MSEFNFAGDKQTYRKPGFSLASMWLVIASAVFVAAITAGLCLGLAARAYVHWSIQDGLDKIDQKRKIEKK